MDLFYKFLKLHHSQNEIRFTLVINIFFSEEIYI